MATQKRSFSAKKSSARKQISARRRPAAKKAVAGARKVRAIRSTAAVRARKGLLGGTTVIARRKTTAAGRVKRARVSARRTGLGRMISKMVSAR